MERKKVPKKPKTMLNIAIVASSAVTFIASIAWVILETSKPEPYVAALTSLTVLLTSISFAIK